MFAKRLAVARRSAFCASDSASAHVIFRCFGERPEVPSHALLLGARFLSRPDTPSSRAFALLTKPPRLLKTNFFCRQKFVKINVPPLPLQHRAPHFLVHCRHVIELKVVAVWQQNAELTRQLAGRNLLRQRGESLGPVERRACIEIEVDWNQCTWISSSIFRAKGPAVITRLRARHLVDMDVSVIPGGQCPLLRNVPIPCATARMLPNLEK